MYLKIKNMLNILSGLYRYTPFLIELHDSSFFSFPGGMMDDTDQDLVTTALRETKEEVGLDIMKDTVWGMLQSLPSRVVYYSIIILCSIISDIPVLYYSLFLQNCRNPFADIYQVYSENSQTYNDCPT